jgi:hypothetical protein
MAKIDQLKIEIEQLPEEEFSELVRWLPEKDWARWDMEIEADSRFGRLDSLVQEAASLHGESRDEAGGG